MSDLRTHLLAVRKKHGELTPKVLVDAARPEDHPLHPRFEWDDTVAAEAHRRWQARMLIATVVRTVQRRNGEEISIREFHAIREDDDTSVYEPLDEIVQDQLMTAFLLNTMKRDWQTLKRRYEQFDEFHKMVLSDVSSSAA